jgi:hypothetical protein
MPDHSSTPMLQSDHAPLLCSPDKHKQWRLWSSPHSPLSFPESPKPVFWVWTLMQQSWSWPYGSWRSYMGTRTASLVVKVYIPNSNPAILSSRSLVGYSTKKISSIIGQMNIHSFTAGTTNPGRELRGRRPHCPNHAVTTLWTAKCAGQTTANAFIYVISTVHVDSHVVVISFLHMHLAADVK